MKGTDTTADLGGVTPANIEREVIAELRRRLSVIETPEYKASTCYRASSRIAVDAIAWCVAAAAVAGGTLYFWAR
jgi:hypothetical protein